MEFPRRDTRTASESLQRNHRVQKNRAGRRSLRGIGAIPEYHRYPGIVVARQSGIPPGPRSLWELNPCTRTGTRPGPFRLSCFSFSYPFQGAAVSITTQITASRDSSAAAIATHQTQVFPIVCITFIAISSVFLPARCVVVGKIIILLIIN